MMNFRRKMNELIPYDGDDPADIIACDISN